MSLISGLRPKLNHSPERDQAPRSIELCDVSKTYGLGEIALSRTGLIIPGGQRVTIHGESGSGKTTLLDIAGGIIMPDTGRVVIGGEDITSMSQTDLEPLRASMGYVLQRPNLLAGLSNMDNIMMPHMLAGQRVDENLIKAMAEELEVVDQLKKSPTAISGGQAQRISIVSALAHNPDIILADEPTAALDKASKGVVLKFLGKFASQRGSTLVIISHDSVPAGISDREITIVDHAIATDSSNPEPLSA